MTTTHSGADIWMIGDLQGCCSPLQTLLAHPDIADKPGNHYWFAGDLINRGPDSLGTLRRVMALGDRATTVLGNHDLHFLAVAAGIKKPGKSDTLQDILDAPDAHELIEWLRHRPLAHHEHGHLLVHAGILPDWTVEKTLALAAEVETALRGPDWKGLLARMYGNEPARWDDALIGDDRLRVIINALTRLRMCTPQGHMEFSHKDAPAIAPQHLVAWFDAPGRAARHDTIVFGHWSTLGLLLRPNVICLDTGCIWGRELTAVRLGDRKMVQVACSQYQRPGHR